MSNLSKIPNIFLILYSKSKGIKKIGIIIVYFVAGLIILFATIAILFQSNKVQNYIVTAITTQISKDLNAQVKIGHISYLPFNTLSIESFYIEDQKKDTLFFAKKLDARFNFWQFFKQEFRFDQISFDQFYGNIQQDKNGKTNLDFLIEALKSDKPKDTTTVVSYYLKNIAFKDSRIKYSRYIKNAVGDTILSSIELKKLNADFYADIFQKNNIKAGIRHLSFIEKSGFEVTELQIALQGNSSGIDVQKLLVKLPATVLDLRDIQLKFRKLDDLSHFIQKVTVNAPIQNSYITLSDLKAFVPDFKTFNKKIDISGNIYSKAGSLKLQKIILDYGKSLHLDADIDINGLPRLDDAFIFCQINSLKTQTSDLQDFLSQLQGRAVVLPAEIMRLGKFSYTGNMTGFLSDIVAYGNLQTDAGSVSTDLSLKFTNQLKDLAYKGAVKSNQIDVRQILADKNFGDIAFEIKTSGKKIFKQPFRGDVTGNIKSVDLMAYQYKDIAFDGKYDGKGFNGNVHLLDPNINADFSGIVDFSDKKNPVFNFDLSVANAHLNALHLIKGYAGSDLSFHLSTDMTGRNLDNIDGVVRFSDLIFQNDNKTLNAGDIQFISNSEPELTQFSINSDYLNGSLSGNFKYSNIGTMLNQIAGDFLPALLKRKDHKIISQNKINIDLSLQNSDEISDILNLPYKINGKSTLIGQIDQTKNKYKLTARIPEIISGKKSFENFSLLIDNFGKSLQLTSRMQMVSKKNTINWYLLSSASADSVSANMGWQNNSDITVAGEVQTLTKFTQQVGKISAHTFFKPTQIIINDSIWNIRKSDLIWKPDSSIAINNFKFESKNQFIHINGIASSNPNDSMQVAMNDLDLEYIFGLINVKGIQIGGRATGNLSMHNVLKEPIYLANLDVKGFSLNKHFIGDAILGTSWNKASKWLDIDGEFTKNGNKHVATAKGIYVPRNDSIDIRFDASDFNMGFLNRYFEGIVSNFGGSASGKIRMFGPTKDILFESEAFIKGGKATLDLLKTTYTFNDSIHLTTKNIGIKNIRLFDEDNNPAMLNGNIRHDGEFSNMKYDIRLRGDNMLAMNTRSVDDDFFYGKAYLGGTVRIHGNDDEANIIVDGISRPKTKVYMSMGTASEVVNNNFIRFVPRNKNIYPEEKLISNKPVVAESEFNVIVDMRIEVTPEAEIEILVDPQAGDMITGRGRGNLRIQFDTFSDVNLYGNIDLDYGDYLFTLQTVIRKEFRINQGSTINWTGDPFEAQVDIKGYYPLTASLSDLMEAEELEQITTRSSVPVNCLLYLTEDLMSPTIKFDIDLPSSDESVKQRVRNIINTEEMMNRQMIYLLLLNKFYTPDYMRTTPLLGVNEGISFATATVSSQLNSWLQQALNSNIFSLGFDWQKSEVVNDEVKAQILIQPNNRLVINGNIGYRNDNINASTNKFIGDFDLEYKLMESGKLRFNAYNHTIDRAQLREAKTTQGVGIIYREDFNNFYEMLDYYWKIITFQNKKAKKQE